MLDKLRGICLTIDVSWRYVLDTLLVITSMILTKKEGRGVRFVTGAGMSLRHTLCRTQQRLFWDRTRHHPREGREAECSLPSDMRQLSVDLHAALPAMSGREIAEICSNRFGRKPSHHSV